MFVMRSCNVLAYNVLMLMDLIEQVEREAGTSRRTDKTQVVTKPRRGKEDSDSEESDFWMLKSSSGSESEHDGDEGNCKGCSSLFLVLFLVLL